MRCLLPFLLLLLAAGCTGAPPTRMNMDQVHEERVQSHLRGRIAIAMAAENGTTHRKRLLRFASKHELALIEDYPLPSLDLHVFIMEAADHRRLPEVIQRLTRLPGVRSVQRINLYRTQGEPGSPASDPLAELQAFSPAELASLHELATGRGVTVVIIDTGLDLAHEDLEGASLAMRDFVEPPPPSPELHATAVTGLLLARPGNGVGLHGLAPEANVIVLRACWQPYGNQPAYCSSTTLARALSEALALEPDVVNLSITGPLDPLLARLVEQLTEQNAIVVAAHRDTSEQGPFPSSLPGVIAATARPLFAAFPGPVYAPGRDVIGLLPGNRYGLHDGSSISAAHVSAIACLFRELNPRMGTSEFDALLRGEGIEADGIAGLVEALSAQLH